MSPLCSVPPPTRWGHLAYAKLKNAAARARINTNLSSHVGPERTNGESVAEPKVV